MAITVVSTGGTTASTEQSGGDASPELTGEDLVEAVSGLGAATRGRLGCSFSDLSLKRTRIETIVALAADAFERPE